MWESIAANIVRFEHIPTGENPPDIMTKALPWHKARVHVKPLLFWKVRLLLILKCPACSQQRGVTRVSDDDLGWPFQIIYSPLYIFYTLPHYYIICYDSFITIIIYLCLSTAFFWLLHYYCYLWI